MSLFFRLAQITLGLLLLAACGTFEVGIVPASPMPVSNESTPTYAATSELTSVFTPPPSSSPPIQTVAPNDLSIQPTATPKSVQTPYYTVTPIPARQLQGEWQNITCSGWLMHQYTAVHWGGFHRHWYNSNVLPWRQRLDHCPGSTRYTCDCRESFSARRRLGSRDR